MYTTKQAVYEAHTHLRHKYTYKCTQPKKGEWYLKPTHTKGVFEVLQAQQDFTRRHYSIVDERILDYMKKHHLLLDNL